ncbi:hypothetical protein AV530_006948 [Patagioenas fasciata monilis]|uniref:Uncharacterized protein n=1 Tax=Patagioenas fasciata monilis TaxID=372326 RepID=A0A1V4KXR6_PATFA|nr:hypothetical protein AV530_006948 [Patagioenas fasciata monilis]
MQCLCVTRMEGKKLFAGNKGARQITMIKKPHPVYCQLRYLENCMKTEKLCQAIARGSCMDQRLKLLALSGGSVPCPSFLWS